MTAQTTEKTAVSLAAIAIVGGIIYAIVEGRRLLDQGDRSLGISKKLVGGDDFSDPGNYPGWLTRWYAWRSGNPEAGLLGSKQGSVFDWDPLNLFGTGSRWGIFG